MNRDAAMTDSEARMQSWGCSIALHGALWGLGLWLISQQAIVPPSTFQWEISLVSPSRESSGHIPSSGASVQSDDRIGSVVTKPVRTSAAALSTRPEIQAEPVVREAVRSKARVESQSVVAVAVPELIVVKGEAADSGNTVTSSSSSSGSANGEQLTK